MKISAGDFVQGSVYDTIFGDEIAIAAYKNIFYDIATFGNHEFNKGVQPLYRTIQSLPNQTTWLSSNTELTDAPSSVQVSKYLDKYDICWVSALTTATLSISNPGPTVRITNPAAALKSSICNCSQRKNVIAVTHVGYEQDIQLCKAVPDLDLIIGGHSHTDLAQGAYPTKVTRKDGSTCWVVQALAYGRYVGMLDVSFDKNGTLQLTGSAYIPTDNRIERDYRTRLMVQVFKQRLSQSIQSVVGVVTKPVDGDRRSCRARECEMGNLVCAAMLAYASVKEGATICIHNGGGVRSSFDAGEVTIEEVLSVLPFGNVHAVLTVSGETVVTALEYAMLAANNDEINGRFPQIAGMKLVAEFDAPPGARVRQVIVNGKPILRSKMYTVVTNAFLANGGDGYKWPGATNVQLSGRGLDTLVSEYLAGNSPYTPSVDGRITDSSAS